MVYTSQGVASFDADCKKVLQSTPGRNRSNTLLRICDRCDAATETKTILARSSSPVMALERSHSPDMAQGFTRRLVGRAPHGCTRRGKVKRSQGEDAHKGLPSRSALWTARGIEMRKDSPEGNYPVQLADSSRLETLNSLNHAENHDVFRRDLLRDISPPGMWPITDDQDGEYV
ncbi:hypothetical protein Mapa_006991 [Marchantia paleacea]|nr:hypothetical protein Mapa_006991 [Marchantia paleacea]